MKPIVINIHNLVENLTITDTAQGHQELEAKITETLNKVISSAQYQTKSEMEDTVKSSDIEETINDDGIMYIKTDCLKIANGDVEKAQKYFEWIINPLKIFP